MSTGRFSIARRKNRKRLFMLVFWVFFPLAAIACFFWWRVDNVLQEQLDRISPYLEIRRSRTFFNLDGEVGITNFYVGTVEEPARWAKADEIKVRTPGFFWLIKTAILGFEHLPAQMGMTLKNVAFDTGPSKSPDFIGRASSALLDNVACGDGPVLGKELKAMGLPSQGANLEIGYQSKSVDAVEVAISFNTPGAAKADVNMDLSFPTGLPVLAEVPNAAIKRVSMYFSDFGFAVERNKYCARRRGVVESDYIELHIEALKNLLAQQGLAVDEESLAVYRQYAMRGGELNIEALTSADVSMQAIKASSVARQIMRFGFTVARSRRKPMPMVFNQLGAPPPDAENQSLADEPIEAEHYAAIVDPGTSPPTESISLEDPRWRDVQLQDLDRYLGSEIVIDTVNNTVRRGVLEKHENNAVTLRLSQTEGTFLLTVGHRFIRRIRAM